MHRDLLIQGKQCISRSISDWRRRAAEDAIELVLVASPM